MDIVTRTEQLLIELKGSSEVVDQRQAIMGYVADMNAILGDGDFATLFVKSLERRGKVPVDLWGPIIMASVKK